MIDGFSLPLLFLAYCPSPALTHWLLKRKLQKALINWRILCSKSPLCVDVVNQITQQLEHIVLQTARCDILEESARLARLRWNLMNPTTLAVASGEVTLARLESVWAHHRQRVRCIIEKPSKHGSYRKARQSVCPIIEIRHLALRLICVARGDI